MTVQPMSALLRKPGRVTGQGGFGLVELMISIAIGLVILSALVALFVNSSRNNREMATASSVIENGRFAIDLLENDIVHAGYWGTFVPGFDDPTSDGVPIDFPTAVPDPCLVYGVAWTPDHLSSLIGIPVQTYADAGTCAAIVAPLAPNSDVLVVRHADTCEAGVGDCPDETNMLHFQSSLCTENCKPPAGLPEAGRYVLAQTLADPGDDATLFSLRKRNGIARAPKRKFVSRIYFLRDIPAVAEDGRPVTIPTLMRSDFGLVDEVPSHMEAVPLIEGIEAFRVELGVDNLSQIGVAGPVNYLEPIHWLDDITKVVATNRGDGVPDGEFIRCSGVVCDENDLANVTAVRIYVLARSRERTAGYMDKKTYTLGMTEDGDPFQVGPFNDGFKRHVYSTTVRLPNVSGRRIRPGVEPAAGPEPEPEPEPGPGPEPLPGPEPIPAPDPVPM